MKYFGTDGIRGKWQTIYNIAFPLGIVLSERNKVVAVARDTLGGKMCQIISAGGQPTLLITKTGMIIVLYSINTFILCVYKYHTYIYIFQSVGHSPSIEN